jgi:hypothetical protein
MPERDELPENFESLEDFWDFWDNHDAGDYWDFTKDVHFSIKLEPQIDEDILQKVKKIASQNGVSVETLINQWLKEKIDTYATR